MNDTGVLLNSELKRNLSIQISALRFGRLCIELKQSILLIEKDQLKLWGKRSSSRLLTLGSRRLVGLIRFLYKGGCLTGVELTSLIDALIKRNTKSHINQRSTLAFGVLKNLATIGRTQSIELIRDVFSNPKTGIPRFLAIIFGFELGSGGIDGNGGVPDLDLLAGIGLHRSPITHSIISGIIIEGFILAIVDLLNQVFENLPKNHDPLWNDIHFIIREIATSASIGLSSGISWHLFVDAFIQPGTYHDLPFHLSKEGHQFLFASNAAAEGLDSLSRYKYHRE